MSGLGLGLGLGWVGSLGLVEYRAPYGANNRRLIGSLKSLIRSAGFNRSQLIGSAEQAKI